MAERIHTGGLKIFESKSSPKLDSELARKIDEGYEKARIRKRKQKIRNTIIITVIIIILTLGIIIFT